MAASRAPIPPIGLADHARSCETVISYRAQHPDLPPRNPEDQRADDRWAFLPPITSLIGGAVQRGACRAINLRQERARERHEIRACRD